MVFNTTFSNITVILRQTV